MTFGFELVDLLNSDDSNRCLAWQKFVDPALCNMQVPCTEACVRQESKKKFGNLGNGSISETKWKWQKTISWFLFFHVFSCVLSVHCCCISISCFLGNRTVSAVLMEMKGNFVLGMSSHRLDAFPWALICVVHQNVVFAWFYSVEVIVFCTVCVAFLCSDSRESYPNKARARIESCMACNARHSAL